jgi:hypothetical protein
MTVSFRAEMVMFRPRSPTCLKIRQGKIIKVTIGLAEPMREVVMIRCLLMSQGVKDLQCDSKEFQDGFKVIPTQLRIQRYKPLVESNRNK